MDLAQWVRNRRFRGLLELIMQLPEASRFTEAKLNDPQTAKVIAQAERERERKDEQRGVVRKWRPRLRDFDLHAQLLLEIREATIRAGDYALMSASEPRKPRRVPMLERPQTLVDLAKTELHKDGQRQIIALFAPHALEG